MLQAGEDSIGERAVEARFLNASHIGECFGFNAGAKRTIYGRIGRISVTDEQIEVLLADTGRETLKLNPDATLYFVSSMAVQTESVVHRIEDILAQSEK